MNNKKPTSCGKVKNACKYCFEQVTNKTGLQCLGACKKWAHFKCLHYTPGKISDIKAGLIKVQCPCPDCVTTEVKEYLVNPPYTCSSHKCPANRKGPLKCESLDCPLNKSKHSEIKECSNKACAENSARSRPRSGSPLARYEKMYPLDMKKSAKTATDSPDLCKNTKCQALTSPMYGGLEDQALMAEALQEMSGTVGQLSNQLQDLMGKMNKLL